MAEKRELCKVMAIGSEPKRLIVKISDQCEDDIIKEFQTLDSRDRAGLIWLIIRTSGCLLWTW